jgi:hypothetical protein
MDTLCIFFSVASLAAFVEALAGRRGALAASLVLAALALLSKEPAAVLPAAVAALALGFKREARTPRGLLRHAGPHAALVGLYLLGRFSLLGGLGGYMAGGQAVAARLRPGTLSAVAFELPRVYLVAANQAIVPNAEALRSAAAALVLVVLAAAVAAREGAGVALLLAGASLLLASFAPVHNMLWMGPELLNARYLYLGGAGFALALAGLLHGALANTRRAPVVAAASLYGVIAIATATANRDQWLANDALVRGVADDLRALDRVRPVSGVEFIGFPHTWRGSYVFNEEFIPELALGRSVPVLWVDDAGIGLARPGGPAASPPIRYHFLADERLWRRLGDDRE